MSQIVWNKKQSDAVLMLAEGYTIKETADSIGVNEKTIDRWKRDIDFIAEMNRLSLMIGIASKAERLRYYMKYARKLDKAGRTNKDILDWLREARQEVEGVRIGFADILASIADADKLLAGSRPDGDSDTSDPDPDQAG